MEGWCGRWVARLVATHGLLQSLLDRMLWQKRYGGVGDGIHNALHQRLSREAGFVQRQPDVVLRLP